MDGAVTTEKKTPSLFKKKETSINIASATVTATKREKSFTDEDVQKAWAQFVTNKKSQGATEAEQLVLDRKMMKASDTSILIYLESPLEATILERFQADVVLYLRDALQNDHVQLTQEVQESQKKILLFTAKDRYEYMASVNPVLKKLKDELGLDVDF